MVHASRVASAKSFCRFDFDLANIMSALALGVSASLVNASDEIVRIVTHPDRLCSYCKAPPELVPLALLKLLISRSCLHLPSSTMLFVNPAVVRAG